MLVISQKRSSCNSFRPNSHLHIYSKATDMKPDWNVLIGLVADQQKEMNRYTIQEKELNLLKGRAFVTITYLLLLSLQSLLMHLLAVVQLQHMNERVGYQYQILLRTLH